MIKQVGVGVAVWAVAWLGHASGAVAGTYEETIDRTLSFDAGQRLELSNTNGGIEVSSWDRGEIRIEARKKVRSSGDEGAREALAALRVVIEETADGVTVDTEYPRSGGGWWNRDASASVQYHVQLPRQADLELATVNGTVRVRGVAGEIELRTTNGDVTVERAAGWLSARTTNGSIDAELEELSTTAAEMMTLRTTNGSITLALPASAQVSLKARTTNGRVETDLPITIQGSVGRNRLEGDINGGGGDLELRTTNGSIRVRRL